MPYAKLRVASMLISVHLTPEPVEGQNSLPRNQLLQVIRTRQKHTRKRMNNQRLTKRPSKPLPSCLFLLPFPSYFLAYPPSLCSFFIMNTVHQEGVSCHRTLESEINFINTESNSILSYCRKWRRRTRRSWPGRRRRRRRGHEHRWRKNTNCGSSSSRDTWR